MSKGIELGSVVGLVGSYLRDEVGTQFDCATVGDLQDSIYDECWELESHGDHDGRLAKLKLAQRVLSWCQWQCADPNPGITLEGLTACLDGALLDRMEGLQVPAPTDVTSKRAALGWCFAQSGKVVHLRECCAGDEVALGVVEADADLVSAAILLMKAAMEIMDREA